jgi:hypothetical protein
MILGPITPLCPILHIVASLFFSTSFFARLNLSHAVHLRQKLGVSGAANDGSYEKKIESKKSLTSIIIRT